ncbi:unnamed protein product [Psylliodes chrysocephalus]|uniref:Lipase n=1 Tax=Psylliodes chrysocephalus TaxID=3402493 RepID=A0A9P0CQV4_9CUCU|nr:unnamed protein product [Psylliodes chrysocephala]
MYSYRCCSLLLNLVFLVVISAKVVKNNVCTTFRGYGNIQNDQNCFYNPDLDSTPSQIAEGHGYALETHTTTTQDGYIISMFRLKRNSAQKKFGQPVILQHGIIVDGLSWMISGNNSLGFNLVSNGFDIWLPNFRGSTFSAKHINSTISDKDYWDFSFHELGIYDVPAFAEKISDVTKRSDIVYIGHSMGSTAGLIYASIKPEHARKYIKGFIFTAPVAFFRNVKGALRAALPFYILIKGLLAALKIYAIGTFPALQSFLTGLACGSYPSMLLCQMIYSFTTGLAIEQVRPDVLPIILKFYPTGTPVKSLIHYAQIIRANGRFQQYDYEIKEENMKKYKSALPPMYEIEKIKVPSHVFASKNDFLSDFDDSKLLYEHLTSAKGMHTYGLGHTDYLYGKDVNKLYKNIVDVIETNFIKNNVIK